LFEATWGTKGETLSQEWPTQKRAGGVAQVEGHLSSKYKAQRSNPFTAKTILSRIMKTFLKMIVVLIVQL
jgi:hypothetical protein